MKKNLILLSCGILCFSIFLTVSCTSKPAAPQSTKTDFEEMMTKADTVAVKQLIDHFFSYIENDQLTDAIGMLYYLPADDHYSEPQLLDNEQLAKTRAAFSSFPIVDHRIDYVKFSEVYSNEVKATAIIEKGEEGKPEICTSIYFKPVNFLGSWRLCVMDTNSGDHSIVDSNSKDSLTGAFSSLKDSLIMR